MLMTLLGDKILSAFTNASAKIVIFIDINAESVEKLRFAGVESCVFKVLKMVLLDIEVLNLNIVSEIVLQLVMLKRMEADGSALAEPSRN